jgi:hypothetical protein
MQETTKKILQKWGAKLKKGVFKMNKTDISLDQFEKFIGAGDIDGTIGELQRLKQIKKKLKKKDE